MTVGPTADAATIAIFGNLKCYTARMCPIEVFISEHTAATRNNLYIRVVTYVGGKRTHAAGLATQVGPLVTLATT